MESEQVPRIVDTDNVTEESQYLFNHAVVAKDKKLIGWHVTDNPQKVLRAIQDGNISRSDEHSELGPGLYVSAIPHIWAVRSHEKWDFLKRLTDSDRRKIVSHILSDRKMTEKGYLSQGEKDNLIRDLNHWLEDPEHHEYAVLWASGQPYNFPVWKPEFLSPLGIEAGTHPSTIRVELRGQFVDMSGAWGHEDRWKPWMDKGLSGAFIKGGFSGESQLVVWQARAITLAREEKMTF